MISTSPARSMSCCQPHSALESESSNTMGQESAMCCLVSGLYSILSSGTHFLTWQWVNVNTVSIIVSLHLIEYLLRGEAHGVHVVGPGGELFLGRHHVLDGAAETVVNVHHGKPGVGPEVALVHFGGQGVVEDLHGVVRGPAPGVRVIRNYSGEPETPKVQTEPFVIIFTEQLSVNLKGMMSSF